MKKEKECFGCGQVHNENWPCPPFRRPYSKEEIEKYSKIKEYPMKYEKEVKKILEKLYRLGRSEYMENLKSINIGQALSQLNEIYFGPGRPLRRLEGIIDYSIEAGLCKGIEAKAPELFLLEDHKKLCSKQPKIDEEELLATIVDEIVKYQKDRRFRAKMIGRNSILAIWISRAIVRVLRNGK